MTLTQRAEPKARREKPRAYKAAEREGEIFSSLETDQSWPSWISKLLWTDNSFVPSITPSLNSNACGFYLMPVPLLYVGRMGTDNLSL